MELTVSYQAASDTWNVYDENDSLLLNFDKTAEFPGLRFNFEGKADLGDSFRVLVTNDNSVNLKV